MVHTPSTKIPALNIGKRILDARSGAAAGFRSIADRFRDRDHDNDGDVPDPGAPPPETPPTGTPPPGTPPPATPPSGPPPFVLEPESVSSQLTGLLRKDSPLMQQARTTGLQIANRRGLLNSSIAVGAAQNQMISAAVPLASQAASQAHAKELTRMSIGSQERIASLNVAAHDRQFAISALTELEKKYGAMWTEIVKNKDIPADARENYFQHIAALRDSDLNLVQQLYNIDIDWASPVATAK